MAELVLLLGTAHAPGQTSKADMPPEPVKEAVARVWAELENKLRAACPDLSGGYGPGPTLRWCPR